MTLKYQNKNVSAENEYVVSDIRMDTTSEQFAIRDGHLVYISEGNENPFSIDEETGHLMYTSDEEESPYYIDENTGHLMTTNNVRSDTGVLKIIKKNLYSEEIIENTFLLNGMDGGVGGEESIISFCNKLIELFNGDDE